MSEEWWKVAFANTQSSSLGPQPTPPQAQSGGTPRTIFSDVFGERGMARFFGGAEEGSRKRQRHGTPEIEIDRLSDYYAVTTPGRREVNEDRFLVLTTEGGWAVYGILDGHGGVLAADLGQHLLQEKLKAFLKANVDAEALKQALPTIFAGVQEQILEKEFNLKEQVCGTTVTLCFVHKEKSEYLVANLGDSEGAIFLTKTSYEVVTCRHSVHDAKEAELVEKKGGFAKDGRVNGVLTVSRSLGDKFLAHILSCEPHVHTSKFPMQGALVLASDGLWDVLTFEEAATILCSPQSPSHRKELSLRSGKEADESSLSFEELVRSRLRWPVATPPAEGDASEDPPEDAGGSHETEEIGLWSKAAPLPNHGKLSSWDWTSKASGEAQVQGVPSSTHSPVKPPNSTPLSSSTSAKALSPTKSPKQLAKITIPSAAAAAPPVALAALQQPPTPVSGTSIDIQGFVAGASIEAHVEQWSPLDQSKYFPSPPRGGLETLAGASKQMAASTQELSGESQPLERNPCSISPKTAAQRLLSEALLRGSEDNITIIVIHLVASQQEKLSTG